MEFSCPVIFALMFSHICFSGSSEELTVNQSPSNITVNEGDSAQISCCWKTKQKSVKVVWYINEIKLSGVKDQTQNCSTLHLTNILKNQTGHYVCGVIQDIPFLLKVKGNGTDLSVGVRQLQKTTTDTVHSSTRLPAASEDLVTAGSSRKVVIIYILRTLPFVCLLMAFFYLNRDHKPATVSKPESEEGLDEDLKAGETQRSQTELSEQEKGRDNSEKPEVTDAATEEEKNKEKETVVIVDVEQDTSPLHSVIHHGNENKTVMDTSEKTNLIADVEDVTVPVLDDIVSVL
ncbi:uncharacterized protein LOC120486063 isoform X2 [Pimephales promelas]|uniref:uncharacterized protein LOC120486063 isoform X2 n=1 Tax=Pimephales promelas TaxID=90988 RepID=UPI001955A12C|nr:uncharacterized protein LOC120486063 isoform X2 [Pimephales promelas]